MTGLSGAVVEEGIAMTGVEDDEVSECVGTACFEGVGTGCEGKADGLFASVLSSDGVSATRRQMGMTRPGPIRPKRYLIDQ